MSAVVRFHRNERSIAISTNAATEQEFIAALVPTMTAELVNPSFGDPTKGIEPTLAALLPQIAEVCCKLRGYKANVTEHRVIVAGEWLPDDVVEAFNARRHQPAVASV